MESFLSSSRSLGEESLQMWDLNKRLEAYLARVKFLEEENELLKAEIQGLKGGLAETPWRAKYEAEVASLRATLDQAYQETCVVELARDSLYQEVQQVKGRCQRERAAQEETKALLSLSKKEMEEERRAHLWLREKAAQLEREAEDLLEAHQEELLRLDQEMSSFSQSLDSFRPAPVCFQPVEVEDYAKRLSSIWKGAVETYKVEVSQLEASLCEAKENLWKATEHNRQNQLQLQQLEKELASLKVRKKALEEELSQQWAQQQGDAEKLQMAMEALEEEKQSLRGQISQVLEDRQQLMHLKMSLSLEVATYRTLLEAESSRLQLPATDLQLARGLRDAATESTLGRLQGLSVDRGCSGSRDVRRSPPALPMLRGLQSQAESPSWGAKIPSSAAREFQKANASLRHSPAIPKSADGLLPPPKEPSAFRLDSSQRSQRVTVTHTEAQAVFCTRPPLAFDSVEPEEASGRSPEGLGQGEEREQEAEREAERRGEEGGKASGEKEEEEEEEAQLSRQPPAERGVLNGPFLSQMVTEAVETAIQEVRPKEPHLESSLLEAVKSQADVSSDSSTSLEEENALPLSSAEGLEKAQQGPRGGGQPTDPLQDFQLCEDFAEVNGGREAWAELQGTEEALEAEAPLALGEELRRAERMEGGAAVLVPGEMRETDEETGFPEWREREVDEGLPAFLGGTLGKAEGEAAEKSEGATEAARQVNGSQEGREVGSPPTDVLEGAPEVNTEEVDGGAEEVEMASPENLLPQEREEPQSPPREDGDRCGLLEEEPLEAEGSPAEEDWSPTTHAALSADEEGQKAPFLEVEQETLESPEEPLREADSAPPESEEEEGLDAQVFCMEDALPRSSGSATHEDGILAGELKGAESREVTEEDKEEEEKKGEVDVGPLPTEDMGDEGTMETEGDLGLEAPKRILDLGATFPGEQVESIQETLQEEQRREGAEEQSLEEQKGGGGGGEAPLQGEGSTLAEGDLGTISGGPESEHLMDVLQMEEVRGAVVTENLLQKKEDAPECSEDKGRGPDNRQAGEQSAEMEEATWPEEVQEVGPPQEAKAPAEDSISPREDSGSQEAPEHSDFIPNSPSERGGAEEEETLQLGETLPGHLASDNGPTTPETPSLPSLGREEVPLLTQEAEAPTLEEDPSASLLLAKEEGMEEGPPKGDSPPSPQEDGPCSQEPLATEGSAEAVLQRWPFTADREDEVPREGEPEELEGAPGLEPEEDPWQEGEVAKGPAVPKDEVGAEPPLEPGDGLGSPADGLDLSYTQQQQQEEEEEEDQGPLDQEPRVVAPAQVSPLTSVTDLGDVVLEGEGSPSGPKAAAESDMLDSCEDECFHVLEPEDLIQQKFAAVEDPPETGFPETFPADAVSLPLESKGGDPDILDIVEQALEFNQELMKAAEDELGGLGKGAQRSPEGGSPPPARLEQGPSQVSPGAPGGSSPLPREAHPLGESQANGLLQEEPSVDESPSELLNGLGQGKAGPPGEEDFVREVTIAPHFCTEDHFPMAETLRQSPAPAGEEGFRSGDSSPEGLEKVSLGQKGQQLLEGHILDDLQQKSCVKGGKETKVEPRPFLFGEEIRRQPLEFRPEGDLDLQPSEDD